MKNIFCLGFGKCGSTTLDSFYRNNPHLGIQVPSLHKELNYHHLKWRIFSNRHLYEAFFFKSKIKRPIATLECSPSFFTSNPSLARTKHYLRILKKRFRDRLRLVLLLRDPLSRAKSQYLHDLQWFALNGHLNHRLGPTNFSDVINKPYALTLKQSLFAEYSKRPSYSNVIESITSILEPCSFQVLFLETDFISPVSMNSKVSSLLGCPSQLATVPESFAGLNTNSAKSWPQFSFDPGSVSPSVGTLKISSTPDKPVRRALNNVNLVTATRISDLFQELEHEFNATLDVDLKNLFSPDMQRARILLSNHMDISDWPYSY